MHLVHLEGFTEGTWAILRRSKLASSEAPTLNWLCVTFWPRWESDKYMENLGSTYLLEFHQPPITKTIQVRQTRHAEHCCRSRDELISDVLLWTPTYGRAKAGRPARTYIQLLCEDTGCSPEDLPEAMNDREKWWERARGIRASGTTWWWCLIHWSNTPRNNSCTVTYLHS